MRSSLLILLLGLALCFGATGCFVLDELDKGNDLMDRHSGKKKARQKAGKETPGGGSGVSIASLKEKGAGTFGQLSEKLEEVMKKEPDPDNVIIRCEVEGRVLYRRTFDCRSLGGQVVMR
jgi:hypothetical protein